ncbi:MAG: NAD(P)-dependent dehydrogenase (short-subunit alcohol dehydrogenase family) [Myxococcota bacterium]
MNTSQGDDERCADELIVSDLNSWWDRLRVFKSRAKLVHETIALGRLARVARVSALRQLLRHDALAISSLISAVHSRNQVIGMGNYLDGTVAVVTGSGRGIGRAEAMAFAAEGAKVVVNDVGVEADGSGGSRSPADDVVAEIIALGGEAVANYDSVADYDGAARIIGTAVEAFGRVDILLNNAAIFSNTLFTELSEQEWDRMIDVDLKGVFNTCKHAVPVMIEQQHGRIINTATSQWRNPEGRAAYAAAKGGVVSLTWNLAWELRNEGITVNAVAPMAATRAWLDMDDYHKNAAAKGLDLKKSAYETARPAAEYVPPMAVYLASSLASHVNGCVFRIGSGKVGIYSHPTEVKSVFKDHIADGPWTVEELEKVLPGTVLSGETKAPHIP